MDLGRQKSNIFDFRKTFPNATKCSKTSQNLPESTASPPRRRRLFVAVYAVFLLIAAAAVLISIAPAQAIETAAKQALLIDDTTGAVLLEKEADVLMPPASMSKLMTTYLVFDRLVEGSLQLDDTMRVSEKAWRMGGSKMFVKVDTRVSVEDLLRGVIVQSGNDASIVLAEGLAGSEEAFADEMTVRAREIGLVDSVFRNATGWPDPEHVMTARDLAILARRVIHDHPQYYDYFAEKTFTYNQIRQGNRNPLLYRETGADGLVPMRNLGREYFHFDREAGTLMGADTGTIISLGQRVKVKLTDAAPVTGGSSETTRITAAPRSGGRRASAPPAAVRWDVERGEGAGGARAAGGG